MPDQIFILEEQGIVSVSNSGHITWTKELNKDVYVNDACVADSIVIFDIDQGLIACSVLTGKTIWEKTGFHFGNLNYDMFSGNYYANTYAKNDKWILAVNDKDVLFLEKSNGKIIRKFTGAKKADSFFENYSVSISGDLLCSFDPIRMEAFSLEKGKFKFWDFYVEDVVNKQPLFFHNNSSGLKASGIIFENDTIYLSNDYGLFALRLTY